MDIKEILERIDRAFEENFEVLRFESGHSLTYDTKQRAKEQVFLYFLRLEEIARSVTETEVRLYLPGQETPNGKKFSIEGIVDIVSENGQTIMYDLKTHDSDYVESHKDIYQDQLNVYAHIWQNLKKQDLHETKVIATAIPYKTRSKVKNLINKNKIEVLVDDYNTRQVVAALSDWQPVVDIPLQLENVDHTIREFSIIVDNIENRNFKPRSPEKLSEVYGNSANKKFATYVCSNCDGRFSCSSWREYLMKEVSGNKSTFQKYLHHLADEFDQEEFKSAGLENQPEIIVDEE